MKTRFTNTLFKLTLAALCACSTGYAQQAPNQAEQPNADCLETDAGVNEADLPAHTVGKLDEVYPMVRSKDGKFEVSDLPWGSVTIKSILNRNNYQSYDTNWAGEHRSVGSTTRKAVSLAFKVNPIHLFGNWDGSARVEEMVGTATDKQGSVDEQSKFHQTNLLLMVERYRATDKKDSALRFKIYSVYNGEANPNPQANVAFHQGYGAGVTLESENAYFPGSLATSKVGIGACSFVGRANLAAYFDIPDSYLIGFSDVRGIQLKFEPVHIETEKVSFSSGFTGVFDFSPKDYNVFLPSGGDDKYRVAKKHTGLWAARVSYAQKNLFPKSRLNVGFGFALAFSGQMNGLSAKQWVNALHLSPFLEDDIDQLLITKEYNSQATKENSATVANDGKKAFDIGRAVPSMTFTIKVTIPTNSTQKKPGQ